MNIGPPRDTMAAQDCEDGLRLYLMNQPGWPIPDGHNRMVLWWPTLKSYQWMRQFEDNNHAGSNGIRPSTPKPEA